MNNFLQTIARFPTIPIMVAGDLMLDHYIFGSTERTSPEAPVPVVLVGSEKYTPGGAANVACNIHAAGAAIICAGITGTGHNGQKLRQTLMDQGIDASAVVQCAAWSTIIKTRIVSQGQQIVRLDYEKQPDAESLPIPDITSALKSGLSKAQAVIVSDYGKGYLQQPVLDVLFREAASRNVRVLVDPKGRDYSRYKGCYAITPNSREAQEATGISTATEAGLKQAAEEIQRVTGCAIVVITRGAEGLALRDTDGTLHLVPTTAREVFDVTGAGDTFIAWLTLGVTAGLPPTDAARLANIAAGIAVARVGPAVVTPLDIRQALVPGKLGKKIIEESSLGHLGEQLRAEGKKIVLANGCFDFLHAGHVSFLQQARAQGDVLVVATNSDESIARLKGSGRPIIAQHQREELLASIEAVDYVAVFAGDTPHAVIDTLRPDVLVKGANYNPNQVEGADNVKTYGGTVMLLPIEHDFHTKQLLG